jgi:hypothetical protein
MILAAGDSVHRPEIKVNRILIQMNRLFLVHRLEIKANRILIQINRLFLGHRLEINRILINHILIDLIIQINRILNQDMVEKVNVEQSE